MTRHILSEETHPTQYRAVERIERTAQRMHAMIEDLLDVSRLERGTFSVRPAPMAPREVLAEAEAMLRPLAASRKIQLDFEGPDALPTIQADAARLVQVLSNLVGNALQFTNEGGRVRVTWSEDGGGVTVRVADTGAGIPADQLPLVFGEFWQGTSAHRRSGIGLGLGITRAIVEAHGGKVGIESAIGAGTTVTFTLPRDAAGPAAATADAAGARGA
jgi:signal transduction histidine kinase